MSKLSQYAGKGQDQITDTKTMYLKLAQDITDETKKEMKKVLSEIQDGTFARNWILENQAGRPSFNARRRQEATCQREEVGKERREKMNWGDLTK